MPSPRFCRYDLRTTDVDAARSFYDEVLGDGFWGGDVNAWKLHEQALAKGARPHWLGHVGPVDVDVTVDRIKKLGGEQLGLKVEQGSRAFAILRDGCGALLAVTSEVPGESRGVVVWHALHADNGPHVARQYAALFGWRISGHVDLGPLMGDSIELSWSDSLAGTTSGVERAVLTAPSDGCVTSGARSRGVHPQWLHFFGTTDIERAMARVRDLGGIALPTVRTPSGAVVAPCDDPQGAAFALLQR
jgi:uncharacterized protein